MDVVRVGPAPDASVLELTRRFGAELRHLSKDGLLPGSYWGDSEAGLRGNVLYVRGAEDGRVGAESEAVGCAL